MILVTPWCLQSQWYLHFTYQIKIDHQAILRLNFAIDLWDFYFITFKARNKDNLHSTVPIIQYFDHGTKFSGWIFLLKLDIRRSERSTLINIIKYVHVILKIWQTEYFMPKKMYSSLASSSSLPRRTGWLSQIWTNILSIYLISLSRFDLATL